MASPSASASALVGPVPASSSSSSLPATPVQVLDLETVPVDILHHILRLMNDYKSTINLSSASRCLYYAIDPPCQTPWAARFALLQHAERHFRQHNNPLSPGLACFYCCRILPACHFSSSQMTGRRSKAIDWSDSAPRRQPTMDRFCIGCGIHCLLFPHLRAIRLGPRRRDGEMPRDRMHGERGVGYWYLCHQCGRMKSASERCWLLPWSQPNGVNGFQETICSDVFTDDSTTAPQVRSKFEQLPMTIRDRIFRILSYRDRIMLAQTSTHFHRQVQPPNYRLYSPGINDMYQFMREREETKHRASTLARKRDIACYGCFRMRPPEKFSRVQLRLTTQSDTTATEAGVRDDLMQRYWERRCRTCLTAMFVTATRDNRGRDERAARLRYFQAQTLCEEEGCREVNGGFQKGRGVMRYRHKDCEGCTERKLARERELVLAREKRRERQMVVMRLGVDHYEKDGGMARGLFEGDEDTGGEGQDEVVEDGKNMHHIRSLVKMAVRTEKEEKEIWRSKQKIETAARRARRKARVVKMARHTWGAVRSMAGKIKRAFA
ncbi:hypothetical protein B0H66DRAFT_641351 [Apodospora peruviana]|uniref:F-box domain-containing protein n=1 Tax=Apodospora peruviana TaxID=516989 RepID=A0AAE0M2M8_9PEZI|nr:hypothetical protein B0H66DRAFT_641351 [Apodospora peruviana]